MCPRWVERPYDSNGVPSLRSVAARRLGLCGQFTPGQFSRVGVRVVFPKAPRERPETATCGVAILLDAVEPVLGHRDDK